MQRKHLLGLGVLVAAVGFLLLPGAGLAGRAPSIAWSPSTYPYGTVDPGQTASHTFTLTNSKSAGSSTGALSISIGGSDAAAFSITSNTCNGIALGKGKSCAVIVQFAPTTAGHSYSATLVAKGKKPVGGSATASLSGSGTPQTGAIRITKVAVGSTTGLEGAHFTVDGTGDYQTAADGTFCISGLALGDHTVMETTPPPGYDLASPATQTVTVASAGTCATGSTAATATFEDPRTNLVPNPGFEDGCGVGVVVPCHWSEENTASTLVTQDGASAHSGSADMAVASIDGSSTFALAHSDCFAISPSTTYNIAGWYSETILRFPEIGIDMYSDASCTQFATGFGGFSQGGGPTPTHDGTWTQISGPVPTTSSDAHFAKFIAGFGCSGACPLDSVVKFDDVSLTQAP